MTEDEIVERVARVIAAELGDDFDHAFENKSEWNRERGIKGGRCRDINEPFRSYYLDAARAVVALLGPVPMEWLEQDGYGEDHPDDPWECSRAVAGTSYVVGYLAPDFWWGLEDGDEVLGDAPTHEDARAAAEAHHRAAWWAQTVAGQSNAKG